MMSRVPSRQQTTVPTRVYPSEAEIIEALRNTQGLITRAASVLGVSVMWLRDMIEATPALQEVVQEIEEVWLDVAEDKLRKQLLQGNIRALEFYLSRKGKRRGYGEAKIEINGTGNFQLNWVELHR